MPKTKLKSGGRPLKKEMQEEVTIHDEDVLCVNQFAFEMIQIIAILSNYKILTITGPKGAKNNDEKVFRRKEVEQKQQEIRDTLKVNLDYVFFLKDFDNIITSYKLENNKLIVEFQEDQSDEVNQWLDEKNNSTGSYKCFYDSIKLLFKQLNIETQQLVKIIIEIYAASDKNYSSFEEKFIDQLHQHPKNFSDLLKWDELYEAAYNEKRMISEDELNEFSSKYSKTSKKNTETKKEQKESKVEQKRLKIIDAEQKSITRMQEIQSPNRPIKYLLRQLFDKIAQNFRFEVEND